LPSDRIAVRCEDVVKTYPSATGRVRALRGVTAAFPANALVAVAGPSGSGKSSLLRLIAGMDRPTSGSVEVEGRAIARASSHRRRRLRRYTVGYVFQRPSDNFLPHLTVGEHLSRVARDGHVHEVVAELGIADRVDHLPAELSGGEQQRAAFAQALVSGARVIVADEPTAELDTASADGVLGAIRSLRERGVTFVLATHDATVMRAADVLLRLDHGEVVEPRRSASGAGTIAAPGPILAADAPTVARVESVSKTYHRGIDLVHAVEDVSFEVFEGEMVGLVGRSGSGKTTLLNLVAGWEHADRGRIDLPGDRLGDAADGPPRWTDVAVVPQKLGLLEELTVRENVAHAAKLGGSLDDHVDRIDELLEAFGLTQLAERRPSETSVGEQQRTALARALLLRPRLLIADEPSGHQDRGWAEKVFAALRSACDGGTACLVATHDEGARTSFDRMLPMRDGRISAER
jgi:ABC-type lipoprotein export system ATPase subunit